MATFALLYPRIARLAWRHWCKDRHGLFPEAWLAWCSHTFFLWLEGTLCAGNGCKSWWASITVSAIPHGLLHQGKKPQWRHHTALEKSGWDKTTIDRVSIPHLIC